MESIMKRIMSLREDNKIEGNGKMAPIRKSISVENSNMEHKKMQELQNKIIGQGNNIALTKDLPDIKKRQFIKAGILGIIVGIGIAVFSKMTRGLQNVNFADATTNSTAVLQSKVIQGTRTAAAASGDASYTGFGFSPTTLIVFFHGTDSTDNIGSGMADDTGTGESMVRVIALNGTALTGEANSLFVAITEGTNTDRQEAIMKSLDADGFTLTWTKNGSGEAGVFDVIGLR